MRAVIMAGGKGTRLASLTGSELPKPMFRLQGKPLLEWQLEQLKRYGITDVTMVVGYLADSIRDYFEDGSRFGIRIDYIAETEPLGTAGALYYLKERLQAGKETEFLLLMGDLLFDFDIPRLIEFHHAKNALITLVAHPNTHPYDSDLIVADPDGRVTGFDSKHNVREDWYDNLVNAGICLIKTEICSAVTAPIKMSLEKDLIAPMIPEGRIYAYRTPEFIRDVGTVDRVQQTERDLSAGLVAAGNLQNPQKAVFLDRDGTLNEYDGFITDPDRIRLIPGSGEAIKLLHQAGYLVILVTNQPGIARGDLSFEALDTMFRKIKTLLGREGACLDDIYYCPHHPDKGFPGERMEYKIPCTCRKPQTGMVDAAAAKYNIDLSCSWVVGDMTMDIQLAKNAGCRSCLVRTGNAGTDGKFEVVPDLIEDNLLSFANGLLRRREAQA